MIRKKNRFILTSVLLTIFGTSSMSVSLRVLTLDSCRILAVENNKELRKADMEIQAARYTRKSAGTGYLPKVFATGIYMRTGKELSLLSDEQKTTLSGLGYALSMPALNEAGEGLVNALRTDTRNMGGATFHSGHFHYSYSRELNRRRLLPDQAVACR